MTHHPISIVVPTYNRAHLIARALSSAVSQCDGADDIIVVDDASSDDTARVVAGFPGVRYDRIDHGGAGRARNRGVELARHRLVAFLDSDDQFLPGTLACRRALMGARPDLVFCFSNFSGQWDNGPVEPGCLIHWNDDDRDWSEILAPGTPLSSLAPSRGCTVDPMVHVGSMYHAEMRRSYIAANTVVVNRDRAGDALRFPEDLPTYEDWECFGRLAGTGLCAYLAFDSAVQHVHGGPRLTDAAHEVSIRARLALLERVWGQDQAFLAAHQEDYDSVCAEQRLNGAKLLLRAGRQADARALLRRVRGGPLWARLARHIPVPALALKAWSAAKNRRR
jgi:hypothetical protein